MKVNRLLSVCLKLGAGCNTHPVLTGGDQVILVGAYAPGCDRVMG